MFHLYTALPPCLSMRFQMTKGLCFLIALADTIRQQSKCSNIDAICGTNELDPVFFHSSLTRGARGNVALATHTHRQEEGRGRVAHFPMARECNGSLRQPPKKQLRVARHSCGQRTAYHTLLIQWRILVLLTKQRPGSFRIRAF